MTMTSKMKKKSSTLSLKAMSGKPKASAKPMIATTAHGRAKAKTARHVVRRDGTGHLDAAYVADLRSMSRATAEDHTVDRAFLRKSKSLDDPLAEQLGEEAVMTMTSAEDQSDQLQYVTVAEEISGPFEVTTARQEFAGGTDRSNPPGATKEPFPTT